ncbi:MAG: class I SAM-dependent methyltransferase, partial [Myxococcota bacterium]|nr:class I SAM-dependent methyltransferase [Myxococcota bacterium]
PADAPEAPARWRAGAFAAWLVEDPDADALQALAGQAGRSYAPQLARLPELLKGAPRPAHGDDPAQARRIAAASRLTHGRTLAALRRVPGADRARHLLDLGCGQAATLAALLARRRDARGVGVELDPAVAEEARERLREAGVSRRGRVEVGDVLRMPLAERGFDLVLVSHLFPYFDADERDALLRRAHGLLAPGGVVAIQTPCAEGPAWARRAGLLGSVAAFDLFLRTHRDLHGLPTPGELRGRLADAGFGETGEVAVLPGGLLRIVWGRVPRADRSGEDRAIGCSRAGT